MHLGFLTAQVPDATTLLHFPHLTENNREDEVVYGDPGYSRAGNREKSKMTGICQK